MRQYRPTIEELKKRNAKEQARKEVMSWLLQRNPERANKSHRPYQAETLLGHPPRSVAEIVWLNEQIRDFQASQAAYFVKVHSSGA